MYSAIFVGDLHLGCKLYNEPELEQDLKDVFQRIIDIAIHKKVTYLIIIGDLFDDNSPAAELVEFVIRQVARATDGGVRVVGISGDHDKPSKDITWGAISGVKPVTEYPFFVGRDYCDDPNEIMNFIRNYSKREKVEWILAHGQEPTLFPFIDDKKKLAFKDMPVFDLYPNIKGIVLGDIHVPFEGEYTDNGKSIYIGYCGSPGVVKSDEIGRKKGLLHWDGAKLERIPFVLERNFVRIDFKGDNAKKFNIELYRPMKQAAKRPVFRIEYNRDSATAMEAIAELYQFGIVRLVKVRSTEETGQEETVNIRTELSNAERVTAVLKDEIPEEDVYKLCLKAVLRPEETPQLLDELKTTLLKDNTCQQ